MNPLALSLPEDRLLAYVVRQINRFFPDRNRVTTLVLEGPLARALEWVAECFGLVRNKYFYQNGKVCFNHLHTDQYAMFLYMLSREVFCQNGDPWICQKIYALNKALHGIDVYYEVELSRYFLFTHPLGTILGRARYGNYCAFYQGVTIGSNLSGEYPVLGNGVVLYSGASVVGASQIGSNNWISVGAVVRESETSDNQIVFGASPELRFKETHRSVQEHYFGMMK